MKADEIMLFSQSEELTLSVKTEAKRQLKLKIPVDLNELGD